MECETWRTAVSALADGEDPGVDPRLVVAHLKRCATCRAFEGSIGSLLQLTSPAPGPAASRPAAITPPPDSPATVPPDLSARVTHAVAIADRRSRWAVVRGMLAVVAIEIIAFSVPALVAGNHADPGAVTVHDARHLGAFSAAYAVGLLLVVVRPARARTMLPVAAVLSGALLITAVVDLVEGRIPLTGEVTHLPELISVILVWLLASPDRSRRPSWTLPSRRPAATVEDELGVRRRAG